MEPHSQLVFVILRVQHYMGFNNNNINKSFISDTMDFPFATLKRTFAILSNRQRMSVPI